MPDPIRRAAVAGTWYPGNARALRTAVDGYLAGVPQLELPGRLVALVSPHAGLVYSGPVAAYGYEKLRGDDRLKVVLVGPSHHHSFSGVALFPKGSFETPLGHIPIDEAMGEALCAADAIIRPLPSPHAEEHSLEMQLPFLQTVLPGLSLVPLLMGRQDRSTVDALAGALATALSGIPCILVASSDLSHYHPAPVANRLDAEVVGDVERFEADSLMARLEASPDHACGGGPIVSVMKAARSLGARHATVLRYADSGDVVEGDKSRVVGYLSAALTAP